ncbi:MAG: BREX-1 system phosphatase PglZ type A [Candidatus Contendobacter sp.]|nr:BREX-1 system phosphatase PglZ type A [Candidatus Contendobacter sp.]
MNDQHQIQTALARLFNDEGQRIVFWNDPDKEFQNTLPFLMLEGVTVLRLDEVGALETKIRLERDEPDGKFLLYSPTAEPDDEDDWLLDIRLYSRRFQADRASILLQDLGLTHQHLRTHLAERRPFFDAKERLQKLKALVTAEDVATDLDRKMIAVVIKADPPELFNLIHTLFHAWPEENIDLDHPPAVWEPLEKFDLATPFWAMVNATFGYAEEHPTLKNFLLRLLLTDYAHHLKGDPPPALRSLCLPPSGRASAVICLAQWRDSSSKGSSYDRLSAAAAMLLRIDDHLSDLDIAPLADVMTFLAVEQHIARSLRERVQATAATINAEDVRAIATRRQTGHWASPNLADSIAAPRKAFHAVYAALIAAADFFALRNLHPQGFAAPNAATLYRAYEQELYRFDQLYRRFGEAADTAEEQGWDIVKALRADLEAHYVNGYLTDLALAWGRFIEPPGSLLTHWQIPQTPNQYRFYDRQVQPWLDENENRRAFVIISDAFRYEAAQELTTELNGKYRFEATLSSQLGVLPSYTALGMASLLPHQTLAYRGTDVLVDGQSSIASERHGILQTVGGLACQYDDLMAKKKEEGREFVKDQRVIYIYHDTVDAIGDDRKTEGKTFAAVRTAITELVALVVHIINNLNGNYIVITADHGFLFTETARVETDKSPLKDQPAGTLLAKKRYLIGQPLHDHDSAWRGQLRLTAGVTGDLEFWIPKGANVFHCVGGARFVHGGAMPQEIVIPVITVRHKKDKGSRGETRTRPVDVQVLGNSHRITTAQHRFQLIQMEPVSERVKPITLKMAVYEGEEPVTDLQTVKFESRSSHLDERKQWVSFVLKDRRYDKKTPYRLVLRDADTGIEQQSVEVIINRAFTDDF